MRRFGHEIIDEKTFMHEDVEVLTQAGALDRIYRKVNADGYSKESADILKRDIDHIGSLYGMDAIRVVLLAGILEKSTSNNHMDEEDLASYLGCTNIEFIRFHKDLRDMIISGHIESCKSYVGRSHYKVTAELMKAIECEGEFKPVKMQGLTIEEVFTRLRKYFGDFRNDAVGSDVLLENIDNLINNNCHLHFCSKLRESVLYSECSALERRMFVYMCHRYITHGNRQLEIDAMGFLLDFMDDDSLLKRQIAAGMLPLQQNELICFACQDGQINTDALSLSDKVKEDFLCEIEPAAEKNIPSRDLVAALSIQPKELFYNSLEQVQVARLESLLDASNFKDVQDRLADSGMRKGFNAIFFGAPGTGKTATVMELARRSGRDVFKVDVSKIKSKWVGESEKGIRAVFSRYRSLCCSSDKAPILLFNEADAIFAKRIENIEHSVDQMNNAIQNIILEEMESIDGILIATTNLLSNLDPAFERRFIFKLEFKLPQAQARQRIWKSMIPTLSEDELSTLADRYDFSGGNIENVARKGMVEYVLSGVRPALKTLEGFCEEELLKRNPKTGRMGFQF